jgi:hypothetical protein
MTAPMYLPVGRQLEEATTTSTISKQARVPFEERVAFSRKHFIEAQENEFIVARGGRVWIDKSTGESYRTVAADPAIQSDARALAIECFVVTKDKAVTYLRRRGALPPTTSVTIGSSPAIVEWDPSSPRGTTGYLELQAKMAGR